MSSVALRDPLAVLRDIERRSRAHAVGLPLQVEVKELWSGIGFRIADTRLVAPLGEVVEILTYPGLSHVPGAKAWVKGIANVRGNLLPIMDLQGYLGLRTTVTGRRSRILVINHRSVFSGLLVDEVLGLKHFPVEARTSELPVVDETTKSYLTGGFRDGEVRWGVFSTRRLAETSQFLHVAR